MEEFQKQVLQRLSRIENAVEILIDRISKLEQHSSQADGEIWEELRVMAKDWLATCDKKRKAIHEITQDRSDRLETRLTEDLDNIEKNLKTFEEKVFSVEKEVSVGETTVRDVSSLQSRFDILATCVTESKVKLSVLEAGIRNQNNRFTALENRFNERGKHWPTLIIASVSALIALGALVFVILKEALLK